MSSVRAAALAAFVACAGLWGAAADAQVYRIVGPDGKVTFSDRPPPDGKASPAATVPLGSTTGSPASALPLELRQVAGRFPVMLYTGADCTPCLTARNFLLQRGVPFTEKTVTSDEDIAALQRLAGSASLPFATIGGQHIRGFSDVEWAQYLDAAGYPRTSQLPPSYRNPPATPLVTAERPQPRPPQAQAPAGQQQAPRAEAAPATPSGPSPSNPAGIRF